MARRLLKEIVIGGGYRLTGNKCELPIVSTTTMGF